MPTYYYWPPKVSHLPASLIVYPKITLFFQSVLEQAHAGRFSNHSSWSFHLENIFKRIEELNYLSKYVKHLTFPLHQLKPN